MQDGDAVNKLGAELMQLFSLHSDVYQLAMEASRASSKKGKKAGAASAEGASQVGSSCLHWLCSYNVLYQHTTSKPSSSPQPVVCMCWLFGDMPAVTSKRFVEGGGVWARAMHFASPPYWHATRGVCVCLQQSAAPTAGQKRPRPSDSFIPVHKQRPRFAAACLAQLCTAIVDDGLMQLPSNYDVSNPDHHAQLAKEAGFRACVLRSCASLLEDAQAAAASALLLQGGDAERDEDKGPAPAAAEVLELGPALYKVARVRHRLGHGVVH